MAVSPQADCEYEQEIRFAVVLYGGVSLAIYMNGIAQKLLRMVRGTARLPKDEKLTGTELIYRELGQRLGLDGVSKTKIEPDSLPRTRFVVDIISGTSAGGINGVALAKALALKCRDLSALKRTWLEEAQLDLLLNDKKSEERRYRVGSKRTSLLNSERMYGKILETLVEMNDPKKCTADAADFADNLDLFVTATDLVGLAARIQLTGQTIQEKVHKAVFHFEYPSPKQKNEFDAEHDPMLAFAARCTSSFPAAFEPMRFDHIGTQLKSQLGGSLEDAITDFEDFFPAYRAAGVEFRNRQFADRWISRQSAVQLRDRPDYLPFRQTADKAQTVVRRSISGASQPELRYPARDPLPRKCSARGRVASPLRGHPRRYPDNQHLQSAP